MLSNYRLDRRRMKSTGTYTVHEASCPQFSLLKTYIDLGEFMYCSTALQRARAMGFHAADGCKDCCEPCHVGVRV